METKPFTVAGERISTEQIDAALSFISEMAERLGEFGFHHVRGALYHAGVSWDNRERAADRLLQRLRKQGLVSFSKGRWVACKNEEKRV